jgi:eukaryotic-like serine/threonine-protein kinase
MNDEVSREIFIFTEAINIRPPDRAAYLDIMCGNDVNLRRKVEALLKAHDRVGDFLEEPPIGTQPNEPN